MSESNDFIIIWNVYKIETFDLPRLSGRGRRPSIFECDFHHLRLYFQTVDLSIQIRTFYLQN